MKTNELGLELKYSSSTLDNVETENGLISGYASLFGQVDQAGDIVQKGAFTESLKKQIGQGKKIKMLWQHDTTRPIGVWDEIKEDDRGLFVKGRILEEVEVGREALALLRAGAVDGLSIGYRAKQAIKNSNDKRILKSVELWEISLVTFPMLAEARVDPMPMRHTETKALEQLLSELRKMRTLVETH